MQYQINYSLAIFKKQYIAFAIIFFYSLAGFSQKTSAIKIQDSIFLYGTPKQGIPSEQWEGQGIRNVISPTLTAVLPDPKNATGTAVIIAPGGAFRFISIGNEGYEPAKWFAEHGIAAFILKYRTEPTPRDAEGNRIYMDSLFKYFMGEINAGHFQPQTPSVAEEDARAAVKLVRSRAKEWNINPARIGIVGFSAGALMAVKNAVSTDTTGRANFIGSLYGQLVLYPVPKDAPPMFAGMASNDPLSGQGGFDMITSYIKAGRSVELHLYANGGHAFGMGRPGTTTNLWSQQFLAWLKSIGMLDDKR